MMKMPKYKFRKVIVRYKNWRVVGIQKFVKTYYDEYKPYTFVDKDGYTNMAYDLKIYKSNRLVHKDRVTSYGAIYEIDKEELRGASGLSGGPVIIVGSGM